MRSSNGRRSGTALKRHNAAIRTFPFGPDPMPDALPMHPPFALRGPWHLKTDVKSVSSLDAGHTWSIVAQAVFAGTHRCYAPGVLPQRDGSLLVTCQDFSTRGHRAFRGTIAQ